MPRPFLTARWKNLFNATYAVPPELLMARVPPGLDLEIREGKAFASLVAFDFLDTRVLGIGWPGYRHFAELNLRFYVRHRDIRGVVFLREFVPRRLIAWIARWIYNEPYLAAPVQSFRQEDDQKLSLCYSLKYGGRQHRIAVTASRSPSTPGEDTIEHFFKEHHWGFGQSRDGKTLRYEVRHPIWPILPIQNYSLDFDFGAVYGPEWRFLSDQQPISTLLAVGSEVSVWPHGSL